MVARRALKGLHRNGHRLCVARQNLLEAWVVATRPTMVNGLGFTPLAAATGLAKIGKLFHILTENDAIPLEWERIVLTYRVSGKASHDARLVAAICVHNAAAILTFNDADFRRYDGILVLHPLGSCRVGPAHRTNLSG